jgi:hypothetical protein
MAKKIQKDKKEQFNIESTPKRPSLFLEFWLFLKYNKKWWLLPILIILLLLSFLILLGGTALAPFIYPLF